MSRRHGTVNRYNGGCRCDACREGWNRYMRSYRRRTRRARVYEGPLQGVLVRLTRLGLGIAQAASERTGRPVDDVVEAALRERGPQLEFEAGA